MDWLKDWWPVVTGLGALIFGAGVQITRLNTLHTKVSFIQKTIDGHIQDENQEHNEIRSTLKNHSDDLSAIKSLCNGRHFPDQGG